MDWLIRKTDPEAAIIFNVGSSNPARRDVSASLLFLRSTSRAQPGKRVWPRQPLWMSGLFLSTHLPCRHAHRPGRLLLLP